MCGITGFLNFKGIPIDRNSLLGVTNSIEHRGHDSAAVSIGGADNNCISAYMGIGLGHRRLSIIDLSEEAAQPMTYAGSKYSIVYNGEMYNYLELREELHKKGHTFKTKSDTEVVLAAYSEWGYSCLHKFNGMFAFALWDEDRRKLFCARDPVGIKPFYYTLDESGFRFSSESKSLQKYRPSLMLDAGALTCYLLSMYVPGEKSFYQGIKKLPPGHYIELSTEGEVRLNRYWSVPNSGYKKLSEDDTCSLLESQLNKSIKKQIVSDVPVGAMLSGGFDSGLIVAMASQHLNTLHTYSIGFNDGQQFSELDIARRLANRYDTIHHEAILTADDAVNILDKAVCSMSEPVSDSAIVPTYYLSKMAASDGVKVILSGTGGDEIFGGYPRYVGSSRARRILLSTPQWIRRLLGDLFLKNSVTGLRLANESLDMMLSTGGSVDLARTRFGSEKQFIDFMHTVARDMLPESSSDVPSLYRCMHFDLQVYLPDLLLMLLDQLTMAHTIEGRVPYLDIDMIRESYAIQPELHASIEQTRKLQRRIALGKLDEETFSAKKQGFSGPIRQWITARPTFFKERAYAVKDIAGLEDIDVDTIFSNISFGSNYHKIFSLTCLSTWYHCNVR
jgi:asparagine synthase (glutamine-hydrolysing)